VTSRCNYHCIFCHREGEEGNHDVLTRSDIALVGRVAALLGIRYFKITGGEPLIRSDIVEIVRSLKQQTNGEVSMVTNGYFLSKYANRLIDAGLDRVNVSMHSLNENTYERIVGVRGLNKVIQGIKILKDSEIPVKINFVVLKYNVNEYKEVIRFAIENDLNINFIELIPLGMPDETFSRLHISLKPIIEYLEEIYSKKYVRDLQARPVYILSSGVRIEIINSAFNPSFCSNCRKIRLTHDGKLKPCLFRNDNLIDISKILTSKATSEEKIEKLIEAFKKANKLREPYYRSEGEYIVSIDGRYKRKAIYIP